MYKDILPFLPKHTAQPPTTTERTSHAPGSCNRNEHGRRLPWLSAQGAVDCAKAGGRKV